MTSIQVKAASIYTQQQQKALLNILTANCNTEIGRRWNFKEISTIDGFREKIPLTTYNDYKGIIERIANEGEQNLLTADKVVMFAPSSATTGSMKLIPITQTAIDKFENADATVRNLLLSTLYVKEATTPCGMPIESISVGVYKRILQMHPDSYFIPFEAYNFQPLSASLYVQLLFGLKDTSVDVIKCNFIPVLISAMTDVKHKWHQMVSDIRSGIIDASLPISSEYRDVLNKKLGGPSPARADQLQMIFEQAESSNFKDIIPAIWPTVTTIQCACSGSYTSFIPMLQHYSGPNIHISSLLLACSEVGTFAYVARPGKETSLFKLVPHMFFEFIPFMANDQEQPPTLLGNEVEEGQIYELVMTATTGFYRYRLGDLVKVIEQTNEGPLIDLYSRQGMELILKAFDHYFYEAHLVEVMTMFISSYKSRVEYIASVDTNTYNRYIVWIECSEDDVDSVELADFIDAKLQGLDHDYRGKRELGLFESLVVVKLNDGTFSKILDFMKSQTLGTEVQLKIPRVVIRQEIEEILKENVKIDS
jgi:hypothetical protein